MRPILMAVLALLPLSASAGEKIGTLSVPEGVASIDDAPLEAAAPKGAITVCPRGCSYQTIGGAIAAAPAGSMIWVDGGPGPEPLTYRGFTINKPDITVCGYGAVRPLLVSDKVAKDGQKRDGDPRGIIAIGVRGYNARLCDLNLRGATAGTGGGAAGLIYAIPGYKEKVNVPPSPIRLTFERMGFADCHGGIFIGQTYKALDVRVIGSWFRNLASNHLNHAIYMSNAAGTLTVERSRFYKSYPAGKNTGSHIRSRSPVVVVRNNVFGEPGDQMSRPLHLAPSVREAAFVGNLVYKDGAAGNWFVIEFEDKLPKPMKRFVIRDNDVELRAGRFAMIRSEMPLDKLTLVHDFADNRVRQTPAPADRPVENSFDWHHYIAPEKLVHEYLPMPGIVVVK